MVTSIIEEEAIKMKLQMVIPNDVDQLKNTIKRQPKFKRRSPQAVFEIIEEDIKNQCKLIEDQKEREEQMHHQALCLIQEKATLKVVSKILGHNEAYNDKKDDVEMRETDQHFEIHQQLLEGSGVKISHLAGTINQSEKVRMQRLIFRITRGTSMVYFEDVERPFIDYKGNKSYKCVFVIIFQEGEYYRERLQNVIKSFLAQQVDLEDFSSANIKRSLESIEGKIKDIRKTIKACSREIDGYIRAINACEGSLISKIQLYKLYLIKEKCLYENLNKMKLGRKFFIGAFWLPRSSVDILRHTIHILQDKPNVKSPQIFKRLDHNLDPPTFIRLNDFTAAFQEITDTYGVPNYKELNPSYFGIVTFPFLFGVMFGDIGHGTILFLFSCFLCLQETTISRTALKSFLPYRYLLLMMGFFAAF